MDNKNDLLNELFMLREILDNLPFAAWFKDAEGRYLVTNKSLEEYMGKTKSEILGLTDYEIFSKEEADIYRNNDKNVVLGQKQKIYEMKLPQGMYKEEGKTPIFDKGKNFLGTTGFSRDVTERAVWERELKMNEERFRTIFELAPLGMAVFDTITGKPIEVNSLYAKIVGRDKEELFHTNWEEYSFPGEIEENVRQLDLLAKGKIKEFRIEKRFIRSDGSVVWVNMSNAEFGHRVGGNPTHICMIEDVTSRKSAEDEVLYLSYYDQLTGLYNRRYYEEMLKKLNRASNLPIALVMADVNGLKLTNDAFGHLAGDQLLKNVGRILKKGCGNRGVAARTGGDEFVLLLPKTGEEEVKQIIQKMQREISNKKKDKLLFSISFGWAVKSLSGQNIKEIYMQAEDQMYKNKLSESSSMRSETIKIITKTLYEKNEREQKHCERVSELCESMGRAMKLSVESTNELKTAGLLHDIGKVGVDEHVLNKKGSLTESEWKEIKRHPEIGYQILKSIHEFAHVAEFVLYHHEKVDGTGYPKGLKGDEIPIQSKIISLADSYDAMTSVRTYKDILTKEAAIEEIKNNINKQFDRELAETFIGMILNS